MRFLLPVLLLLSGLAIDACARGPVQMHQHATAFELNADSLVIPMRRVDGRIVVDAMLDDKGPFPFIFDTGAQGSVLDLTFAHEQGLALGQEITVGSPGGRGRPGNMVTIEKLEIGALTMKNVMLVAFDGLPFARTATSPRGVLSPYGLSGLMITLDYPGERLVFRRGALPEPDGRELFGWERTGDLPEIPVVVGGLRVAVHLDSGASFSLSLPAALASQLTLDGPLVDMGFMKRVDIVKPVRGAPLLGVLTIGRYSLENPILRFVDMSQTVGNVGAAILGQFAITIDPANARLRLTGPANGRLEVSDVPKPRYGVQLDAIDANPLKVFGVDEGSPAQEGGLRAGDEIVRVNGRPIGELSVDDRLEALKNSPLRVTVKRGGSTMDLTMALPSND